MYDITPGGSHRERRLPFASDSAGEGQVPPQQQQQHLQHLQLRTEAGSSYSARYSARFSRGSGGKGRAGRQGDRGSAASGQAAVAAGPRPYFWRLQQRLQAGAYRPGSVCGAGVDMPESGGRGGGGEAAMSEADCVLLWRRLVYEQVRCGVRVIGGD